MVSSSPSMVDDQSVLVARLRQFLTWFLPILLGVSLLQFGLLLFVPSLALTVAAGATFCYVLPIFLARQQAVRGHVQQAVFVVAGATIGFALVMIVALPGIMTAVAVLPIIAIVVTLPYVTRESLRAWSIVVWLATMAIVVLGEFVALFEPPPGYVLDIIQLSCMAPGMVLLLMLVEHYHTRMTETLSQVRASNQSLQQIQVQLEQRVEELQVANEAKVAKEYLEEVVRDYSDFAHRVAQGDLTVRLTFDERHGHEELLLLGQSLNEMVASLGRMTAEVQQASSAIAAAAGEILSVSTHQASSTAQKSAAISEMTTTAAEVKSIAQQVAQEANLVAQESQSALQLTRQGTQVVDDTVMGMNGIRERMESIAQTILSLSEQTQAIGMITTTVSELADQSNLLALNAAIEAARAGEQGRSFAVVAQQVRELAERSKQATTQVQEILGEIQRATNAAVMATEEGTKGVEEGTRLANAAGQVIKRISSEIESGAQTNVQMASASNQATTGMEHISQAVASLQQATNEMASGMRQAEQAAQDLNKLAQSLQTATAVYKVK
jgi:methyl-accepting chemotaxis protein